MKSKNEMTLDEITAGVEKYYPTLRRPNGQLYGADMLRSIKGALSANGLFAVSKRKIIVHGGRRKSKYLRKAKEEFETVWRLKESEAEEYLKQEMVKFVSFNCLLCLIQAITKGKLNQRGRKHALTEEEFNNTIVPETQFSQIFAQNSKLGKHESVL